MRGYIIKRLLAVIPTFWLVTLIVFFSVRFVPGSAVDIMVRGSAKGSVAGGTALTAEAIRHKLGLDKPIYHQYAIWMGVWPDDEGRFVGLFQGNLGRSMYTNRPVVEAIGRALPVSIELALLALIIAQIIALPIGIYSAVRQDSWGDYAGRTVAILGISVPGFWVATLMMVYPAIWWSWTPAVEYVSLADDPLGNLGQLLPPAVILGGLLSGLTMRMVRTMMLEVLRQDYIRTAWAKGLSERTVIMKHALKNALIPVVTLVGIQIPYLIGGQAIMEIIFVLPGVGSLLVDAITLRDYAVISGINAVLAPFVLAINISVDLTYVYLDPRIRYR